LHTSTAVRTNFSIRQGPARRGPTRRSCVSCHTGSAMPWPPELRRFAEKAGLAAAEERRSRPEPPHRHWAEFGYTSIRLMYDSDDDKKASRAGPSRVNALSSRATTPRRKRVAEQAHANGAETSVENQTMEGSDAGSWTAQLRPRPWERTSPRVRAACRDRPLARPRILTKRSTTWLLRGVRCSATYLRRPFPRRACTNRLWISSLEKRERLLSADQKRKSSTPLAARRADGVWASSCGNFKRVDGTPLAKRPSIPTG